MIQSYQSRTLETGQKVKVYFNLRTKLFSVQDFQTGLVVAHGDNILLEEVAFEVSETGRQRVLRERCKNVHAYAVGIFTGSKEVDSSDMKQAYYNPYEVKGFMVGDKEIKSSPIVYMSNKKIFVDKR